MRPHRFSSRWANEQGAGSVFGLGILLVGFIFTTALTVLIVVVVTLSRAQAIVDSAALAAADTLSGRIPGVPCEVALRQLGEFASEKNTCTVSNLDARVTVNVHLGSLGLTLRAHAGPPR